MGEIQLSGVASVLVASLSLFVATRVLAAMGHTADASRHLLRYTGQVLFAVGLLGAGLIVAGALGFFAWLIAMGVWWRAAVHYRAMQKRNLFAALTLAANKQMPLAPMALAFAAENEGGLVTRAQTLAVRLEAGGPLSEAVARSRSVLPPEAALTAQVGEETGDLAGALQATSYESVFDRTLLRPVMLHMIYVFPIAIYFMLITLFMRIKIEPSMIKIFDDFGLTLPNVAIGWSALDDYQGTDLLQGAQRAYLMNGPPIASLVWGPIAFAGVVCFLLPFVFAAFFLLAWLQWRGARVIRLPWLTAVFNWANMGYPLRILALGAERGRPLPRLVNLLGRFHPKRSLRVRFRAAGREIDNGQPWQQSLRGQQLIGATDAAVLVAAQRNGNLPWALREMAESFERRASYRLQAWAQLILPLILLPVGLMTALLVISYFLPLVVLIRNLS